MSNMKNVVGISFADNLSNQVAKFTEWIVRSNALLSVLKLSKDVAGDKTDNE